ncbi:hypothetical protein VNO80_22919 [Phaseolus coccineus]|uniref:Uncharacterized protein n=1 Tax=Phaseolus coccineus TaxID=3886 RepID=A0AAN9QVD5_PHACN
MKEQKNVCYDFSVIFLASSSGFSRTSLVTHVGIRRHTFPSKLSWQHTSAHVSTCRYSFLRELPWWHTSAKHQPRLVFWDSALGVGSWSSYVKVMLIDPVARLANQVGLIPTNQPPGTAIEPSHKCLFGPLPMLLYKLVGPEESHKLGLSNQLKSWQIQDRFVIVVTRLRISGLMPTELLRFVIVVTRLRNFGLLPTKLLSPWDDFAVYDDTGLGLGCSHNVLLRSSFAFCNSLFLLRASSIRRLEASISSLSLCCSAKDLSLNLCYSTRDSM